MKKKIGKAQAVQPAKVLNKARKAFKSGNTHEALDLCNAVLERFPENREAKELRVRCVSEGGGSVQDTNCPHDQQVDLAHLFKAGRFSDLAQRCDDLLNRFPDSFFLHKARGVAHLELNLLEEARQSLLKAHDLEGSDAETLNALGRVSELSEDFKAAATYYRMAVGLDPSSSLALVNLGAALQSDGNPEDAIISYDKALALDPSNVKAAYNKGTALEAVGDKNAAIEAYKRVLEIDEHHVQAMGNLALIYMSLVKLDAAVSYFERATQSSPSDFLILSNYSVLLTRLGREELAIEKARAALDVAPLYAPAHSALGEALVLLGDNPRATASFKRAAEIDPGDPNTTYNIATSYAGLGKTEKAIEHFEDCIRSFPNFALAHLGLSALKTFEAGDRHFQQMIKLAHDRDIDLQSRSQFLFAIAKAYEDQQDFESAFNTLQMANASRKEVLDYDLASDTNFHKALLESSRKISGFDNGKFRTPEPFRPIFIVGMPRSGTTLIEQVLSAHSSVNAGGELTALAQFGGRIATNMET